MYKKCEEILNKLESEGKIKISDYQFPPKQELKLKLKDMLEDEVDEKYYLTDSMINYLENGKYNSAFIRVKNATKKGYQEAFDGDSVNLSYPASKTRRGRVGNQVSQTLQTSDNIGVVVDKPRKDKIKLRIRKLTPLEFWRLMGFDDEDFEKAAKVNSNTQLYKQAGNSIVVNVLMAIFKELIK